MRVLVQHRKGKHYATLSSLIRVFFISLFYSRCRLIFTDESRYDLKGVDQADWNKVIGRGGTKYNNGKRESEQFLVWRYDIENDIFQYTDYWRIDYEMEWLPANHIEGYRTTEWITLNWFYSTIPLGGYFGGNKPAPNDLSYYIEV
jgi:hypothetical protein